MHCKLQEPTCTENFEKFLKLDVGFFAIAGSSIGMEQLVNSFVVRLFLVLFTFYVLRAFTEADSLIFSSYKSTVYYGCGLRYCMQVRKFRDEVSYRNLMNMQMFTCVCEAHGLDRAHGSHAPRVGEPGFTFRGGRDLPSRPSQRAPAVQDGKGEACDGRRAAYATAGANYRSSVSAIRTGVLKR